MATEEAELPGQGDEAAQQAADDQRQKHDALAGLRQRTLELSEEFAPAGIRVQFTGPWPAYSFCPTLTEPT